MTPADGAVPETLCHVRAGQLSLDTAQTPGMQRREAVSGTTCGAEGLWMGETHLPPRTRSANHHHGHSETGIYVLSGHPVFVVGDGSGAERRVDTSPGDYVFVPPYVPHREENPSPDGDAVVVIARTTQEAIAVNLGDDALTSTPT